MYPNKVELGLAAHVLGEALHVGHRSRVPISVPCWVDPADPVGLEGECSAIRVRDADGLALLLGVAVRIPEICWHRFSWCSAQSVSDLGELGRVSKSLPIVVDGDRTSVQLLVAPAGSLCSIVGLQKFQSFNPAILVVVQKAEHAGSLDFVESLPHLLPVHGDIQELLPIREFVHVLVEEGEDVPGFVLLGGAHLLQEPAHGHDAHGVGGRGRRRRHLAELVHILRGGVQNH
mmetsp:Transcript_65658/g.137250  ORF Transcript_65658/g.137250 Transcript_65658/m.137250 type:complete len:232 (+) Transcript_65658:827-1522(+)